MFKKLIELFSSKKHPKVKNEKTTKSKLSQQRKKIESNRIGQLGEHKINIQLDQLPKECKYLHDIMIENKKSRSGYSQIDHIVISPNAIFVIETKNYNGEIKGAKKERYWSVSNRFKMQNPLLQNYGHIKALESVLRNHKTLRFISLVSFTMRCRFSIDPDLRKIASDELIVYDVELSEYISRKINRIKAISDEPVLSSTDIEAIYKVINESNIIDPSIRVEHVKGTK